MSYEITKLKPIVQLYYYMSSSSKSDQVIEDSASEIEKNIEDKEFIEEYREQLRLKNMDQPTPNTTSSIETIKSMLLSNSSLNQIEDISIEEPNLVIHINTGSTIEKIQLHKDSTELANLLAYHKLNSIIELQGKYIFKNSDNKYEILKEISSISKALYKFRVFKALIFDILQKVFDNMKWFLILLAFLQVQYHTINIVPYGTEVIIFISILIMSGFVSDIQTNKDSSDSKLYQICPV